jgi:hypothetical protein
LPGHGASSTSHAASLGEPHHRRQTGGSGVIPEHWPGEDPLASALPGSAARFLGLACAIGGGLDIGGHEERLRRTRCSSER